MKKKKKTAAPDDEGMQIVPARGELADAVHAMGATAMFSGLAVLLGPEALLQEAEMLEGGRDLARGTVLRALGDPEAPSAEELKESAAAQMEAIRSVAEGPAVGLLPATLADVPKEVLGEVTELLREAGLEEVEHDVLLGIHEEEGLQVVLTPVTRTQSYVWLLGPMYERIEAWVRESDLLAMERVAARWWFEQWTPPHRQETHEFARGVREQEFALVDRPFLGLDDLTAVEFLDQSGELEDFPAKQRHMARQLRESFVGVWEVRGHEGEDAVFVSPLDGTKYRVREHSTEQRYGPGALGLGRLIPFGDGTWLRSPGMIFVDDAAPGQARIFAEALTEETENLPDAAKVEVMITTLTARTKLPRKVLPGPGVREAGEILQELLPLMLEAEIAREVTVDELPPEVDRSRLPEGPFYDYEVDVVMADWMTALGELARKGESARGAKRKKEAKGKKTGRKRGGR